MASSIYLKAWMIEDSFLSLSSSSLPGFRLNKAAYYKKCNTRIINHFLTHPRQSVLYAYIAKPVNPADRRAPKGVYDIAELVNATQVTPADCAADISELINASHW
ncbi:MAG: hypothetical protein WC299_05590 [Kiritimatiellia bacterium]